MQEIFRGTEIGVLRTWKAELMGESEGGNRGFQEGGPKVQEKKYEVILLYLSFLCYFCSVEKSLIARLKYLLHRDTCVPLATSACLSGICNHGYCWVDMYSME